MRKIFHSASEQGSGRGISSRADNREIFSLLCGNSANGIHGGAARTSSDASGAAFRDTARTPPRIQERFRDPARGLGRFGATLDRSSPAASAIRACSSLAAATEASSESNSDSSWRTTERDRDAFQRARGLLGGRGSGANDAAAPACFVHRRTAGKVQACLSAVDAGTNAPAKSPPLLPPPE